MTTAASQSEATDAFARSDKDVAIVGCGVAGLTCALRLSERGYNVTLYEKTPVLGGNLSSEPGNGMYYDVYPHLFCDWYVNFWQILEEDLKIKRDEAFEPQMGVKVLQDPKGAPTYQDLKNPTIPQNIWGNLWSGVLPPPDMFLVGFTLLDLASQPFHPSNVLEQQTVNGFLYSRRYATEACAELLNMILMEIWSIPSNDTSAASYKDFVRPGLRFSSAMPFAWLLRGSLEEKLITPWHEKLRKAGCNIKTRVEVTRINLGHDHKVELRLKEQDKPTIRQDESSARHTNVVLAVPSTELAQLVMRGDPETRIVDKVPKLAELRRLRTARILVVNVYFKDKLPDIPRETVGLAGSLGYLTFLDISQLWTSLSDIKEHHTVLVLAASDAYAYPEKAEEWAHMMIKELARYLPAVRPGAEWNATDSNIDYSRSWCQDKYSRTLFLNDVDTDSWQPEACYRDLPSVFLAGDFCLNDVKMATVEAAVLSGLEAANAVQMRVEGESDITIAPRRASRLAELLVMKLGLLPVAYGATAWSTVNVALNHLAKGEIVEGTIAPLIGLSSIPLNYLAEWVGTIDALAMNSVSPANERYVLTSPIQDALGLAAQGLLAAGDYLRQVASGASLEETAKWPNLRSLLQGVVRAVDKGLQEPPPSPSAAHERRAEAAVPIDLRWVSAAAGFLKTLGSAIAEGRGLPPGSGRYRPRSEHVRRHRAKR
jgi:protoporphyrinogen oxidase